jgi:hypothetical protein
MSRVSDYCVIGTELMGKIALILSSLHKEKPGSPEMVSLGKAVQKFNEHALICPMCLEAQSTHGKH